MQLFFDNGITIQNREFKLILDPENKSSEGIIGISHAHADHSRCRARQTLATPATSDLIGGRRDTIPTEYGRPVKLDGLTVTAWNANHVLGSCQFEIDDGEGNIVYTGDLRLQPSFFWECDVPEADTLVIESTYGLRHFKFPTLAAVQAHIRDWVCRNRDKNIVFGAYSLGKSQELIRILNDCGIVPVVHPRIAEISAVYEKNGICLGDYVSTGSDAAAGMMQGSFASIVPQRLMTGAFFMAMRQQSGRPLATALVTGWGVSHGFGVDRVFALSDHCDFYQLMDYVRQSKAKRVYTVHGYEREFAAELRSSLGVEARPLRLKQSCLGDF
jgi:Cft2 family RNA processing exonuclease